MDKVALEQTFNQLSFYHYSMLICHHALKCLITLVRQYCLTIICLDIGLEVLTLVIMKSAIFCDKTPFSPLKVN
jgi:hypothetical protein